MTYLLDLYFKNLGMVPKDGDTKTELEIIIEILE